MLAGVVLILQAAPPPVSAYLHSATMVNLGVYLMARFDEAMGGVGWWATGLTAVGAVTAAWAALQALRERDLDFVAADAAARRRRLQGR